MLRSLITHASLEGFEAEMADQRADSANLQGRTDAFAGGLTKLLQLSAQQLADARNTCTRELTDTLQKALADILALYTVYIEELNKHILTPYWIAHGMELAWVSGVTKVAAALITGNDPYGCQPPANATDNIKEIGNRLARFVGQVNTVKKVVQAVGDSYAIGPGGRRFGPCNAHQSWKGKTTPPIEDYGNLQPPDGAKTVFFEIRGGNPNGGSPGGKVVLACPAR